MQYQINHLACTDGDKVILDSISFPIKNERTLVILGPGGSGKSTLLNYLNRSLPSGLEVTHGRDIFQGRSISYLTQNQVYQQDTFEELFKDQNRDIDYDILGIWEDPNVVSDLLLHVDTIMVQIPKRIYKLFELTLFISSLRENDIILLDEPDVNLHEYLIYLIFKLNKLKQKKTIVIVTHNLLLASEVADDLMYLRYGRVVEHGITEKFLASSNRHVQYLLKYGC